MSWMIPKVKLDRDQQKAIDRVLEEGNFFVKGEAGTGKSIVLAHAALLFKHENTSANVCVLTYTNALVACLKEGLEEHEINIDCMTFHKFMRLRGGKHYDLVFIDEAQDLEPEWCRKIQAKGDKFVLFGDFAQSIYGFNSDLVTEPELIEKFAVREVIVLKVDYRLPKNIRELVKTIYMDREFHAVPWRLMSNAQIPLFRADDWEAEMDFVIKRAMVEAVTGSPVAILFERKKRIFKFFHTLLDGKEDGKLKLEEVNDILKKHDIPFRFFGGGIGDFKEGDEKPLTYVMTWHSAKGLDFESVILPDIADSPCRCNPFYVALSRARHKLTLTYSGKPNDQIEKAKQCKAVCVIAADRNSGRVGVTKNEPQQGMLF